MRGIGEEEWRGKPGRVEVNKLIFIFCSLGISTALLLPHLWLIYILVEKKKLNKFFVSHLLISFVIFYQPFFDFFLMHLRDFVNNNNNNNKIVVIDINAFARSHFRTRIPIPRLSNWSFIGSPAFHTKFF